VHLQNRNSQKSTGLGYTCISMFLRGKLDVKKMKIIDEKVESGPKT
jgi:hypothetical protein